MSGVRPEQGLRCVCVCVCVCVRARACVRVCVRLHLSEKWALCAPAPSPPIVARPSYPLAPTYPGNLSCRSPLFSAHSSLPLALAHSSLPLIRCIPSRFHNPSRPHSLVFHHPLHPATPRTRSALVLNLRIPSLYSSPLISAHPSYPLSPSYPITSFEG